MRFIRRFGLFLLVAIPLLGAVGVYLVKYQATFHAEKIAKLKAKIRHERDVVAVLKAEIAYLSQPNVVAAQARQHLDLVPMHVLQLSKISDLPKRGEDGDDIGRKLEALGIPLEVPAEPSTTGAVPAAAAEKKGASHD